MGSLVYRLRWWIVLAWLALAGAVWLLNDPTAGRTERVSFLPAGTPYQRTVDLLARNFPRSFGYSTAAVIFERPTGPLTQADQTYINRFALHLAEPIPDDPARPEQLKQISVLAPGAIDVALGAAKGSAAIRATRDALKNLMRGQPASPTIRELPNPLRSEVGSSGQAAFVRVNIPADFITKPSMDVVEHLRAVLQRTPPPAGLDVAITGTGGYGYDYARFVQASRSATAQATLLAVVVVLLLVYRAPLAAAIPLIAIGLASWIVIHGMDIATRLGATIGMAEHIFVFVLMYGAGVDYTLLLLSRAREQLAAGRSHSAAITEALDATAPAIGASGATDAAGLLMLVFCQFLIFKTTGPAVAAALTVALLAALSLAPALAAIAGRRLFWPVSPKPGRASHRSPTWTAVARLVTSHPGAVLIVMALLLAGPAWRASRITWGYDALSGIDPEVRDGIGNAAAGVEMARRHWPIGEIAPVQVVVDRPEPMAGEQWAALSKALEELALAQPGVEAVRSLHSPLGRGVELQADSPAEQVLRHFAAGEYLDSSKRILRMEILLSSQPLGNDAMTLASTLQARLAEAVHSRMGDATVGLAGSTAQMLEIRRVTSDDFRRVVVLVLSVVFVIVLLLLRDLWLTLFMVALIGVSYLASLGLFAWIAPVLVGAGCFDWKVQIFLFVVMAALGVDYNIFLAARLGQEARRFPPRQAVAEAMIHTGPVISSCGLIMACTLGSLMVGHIQLLKQLGLAFAIGMTVETFLVRPLVLPSFAALYKRFGRSARLDGAHQA
jgi:putative drug exporter of the RND superfamily